MGKTWAKRFELARITLETVEKSWLVETYPLGFREPRPTTVDTRVAVLEEPVFATVEIRLDDVM